jgi:hypothetical protein
VLYGLVLAHRLALPERRRELEALVRRLRTHPSSSREASHRDFALAALGDPAAIAAVRTLVARVGLDNGEYEEWTDLVPAIGPALCRRLLRSGVRDSEFHLEAANFRMPSPAPELDGREDAGWAVLARRTTEANLAVLRRALASDGPLVYVAAKAMAADPRVETA